MNLNDLYDHEVEASTHIKTEFPISVLSIIVSEFKKYTKYKYKLSVAATFASEEDEIICKFWADSVYRRERDIDPRAYQDNFAKRSKFLIADFEEVVSALSGDEDVINSKGKDTRKPVIKRAMRKYLPDLKILDARKARKKARKDHKELARAKKAVQQNAQLSD